jgi:hypothetical protein
MSGTRLPTIVAVGPTGADISTDDGESWRPLGTLGFHALSCSGGHAAWAVGESGAIGKLDLSSILPGP